MLFVPIIISSYINGSLKMIDCGIGNFGTLDSTLKVGDIVTTRVTFNKTFDKAPIVVVSMREHFGGAYFSYIGVDGTATNNSFNAVATINNSTAWKYTPWYFTWIAISA